MGAAPLAKLPPAWLDELGKTLDQADEALMQQGIAAIRARNLAEFDVQARSIGAGSAAYCRDARAGVRRPGGEHEKSG